MSKDLPRDVLLAAAQTVIMFPAFKTLDETSRAIDLVGHAILAERERCAQILLTKHENHPQDGVNWDGTYYDLYEQILAGG